MPERETNERKQFSEGQGGTRINKFLSEAGVCSRREADRQIEAGNVTIDGRTAVAGDRVLSGQRIVFCGETVSREEEMILLAFHKPRGIVCTAQKREKNNVVDYIHYPKRIYGNRHEKEYLVTVNKPVSDAFIRGLAGGVPLVELGVTTRKCRVERVGRKQFRIVLTQGLNRQIRRMCEYFGYRVQRLVRVRIMNIELGNLQAGTYRNITEEEYIQLQNMIADSSNEPVRSRKISSADSIV